MRKSSPMLPLHSRVLLVMFVALGAIAHEASCSEELEIRHKSCTDAVCDASSLLQAVRKSPCTNATPTTTTTTDGLIDFPSRKLNACFTKLSPEPDLKGDIWAQDECLQDHADGDIYSPACSDFMECLDNQKLYKYSEKETLQQVYDSFILASLYWDANQTVYVPNPLDDAGCFDPAGYEMAKAEWAFCQCLDPLLKSCGTNQGCMRWMMCADLVANLEVCSLWKWETCHDFWEKPCDPINDFESCEWEDWQYWGDLHVQPMKSPIHAGAASVLQRTRSRRTESPLTRRQSMDGTRGSMSQETTISLLHQRRERGANAGGISKQTTYTDITLSNKCAG